MTTIDVMTQFWSFIEFENLNCSYTSLISGNINSHYLMERP